MGGAFTENGPLRIMDSGELSFNEYAWTKHANMLYFDSPVGVGFSYSDEKQTTYNDNETASQNLQVITEFLKKHPELQGRDLYLSGESYAGHYVPFTAQALLDAEDPPDLNLKGIAVGNPLVQRCSNLYTEVSTFYNYALLSTETFEAFDDACHADLMGPENICTKVEFDAGLEEQLNPSCLSRLMAIHDLSKTIDLYALDFPLCSPHDALQKGQTEWIINTNFRVSGTDDRIYQPCAQTALKTFLNRKDIQQQLGARAGSKWTTCSNAVSGAYKSPVDVSSKYRDLIDQGLRVLVYSGTDDAICSTQGSEVWIDEVFGNETLVKNWEPWLVNDQVIGNVNEYSSGFTFVTVRGAGHMVPATKPVEALHLFERFLKGTL